MKFITAIDRYIFRLVLMPMLGVFALAASLLVLDKMLKLFDFVATEGGPVGVVFEMLANLLPEYASLAIPLGLLMGVLFAFRKLATTSELDVMRAVGLSYTRLLRVPYLMTAVLTALNLFVVGYLQPLARYNYEELQFELRSGALGASIKVGEFTALGDDMAMRIERSRDDGRQLIGLFVRIGDEAGEVLTISAREGRFMALQENPDTIILRLSDGQIIQDSPRTSPRVLSFSRHDLPIDLPAIEEFRARGVGKGKEDREFILPELLRVAWSEDFSEESQRRSRANLNYRLVEVVMMLMMPLLGVALGIPPKRSTSALGVFVAVVMATAYHKVNEYGQSVAALGRVDPMLALWGPFVLFAALIFWMYWRVAYVPGGQAIGALERFAANAAKRLRALTRRRAHSHQLAAQAALAADAA